MEVNQAGLPREHSESRICQSHAIRMPGGTGTMRTKALLLSLLIGTWAATGTGCKNLFPSGTVNTVCRWESFAQAQADFDQIIPYTTTVADLQKLGYDPYATPNAKLLTFLDVLQRFLVNPSVRKEDMPQSVQDAALTQEHCWGFEMELSSTDRKRFGNLFLDMTGFRRNTRETGWAIKVLIVLKDDVVVYKLRSGAPHLNRLERIKKPLGPLQEVDSALRQGVASVSPL